MNGAAVCLIVAGALFMLVGSVGMLRLPDFYTRAHAAGKCDTLGLGLILLGLAVYQANVLTSTKLLLIAVFVGIANPTALHALARAAYRLGLKPWGCETSEDGVKGERT
ncbi:MAG: monovalent cation/H(+) antiporter subunit G [Planctomycetes bacterium]|nr:monovalent cation/H(+) antiporter subunit G [Planctomycetota bacterium]MBM4083229.1 monovalent cation/H(+) antiporter subunit G [Planctomycetota bacterium]